MGPPSLLLSPLLSSSLLPSPLLSLDLSWLECEDLEDRLFDSFLESFLEPLLEPLELVRGRWDLCVWLGSELVLISRERLELPLSLPPLPREALELDLGF